MSAKREAYRPYAEKRGFLHNTRQDGGGKGQYQPGGAKSERDRRASRRLARAGGEDVFQDRISSSAPRVSPTSSCGSIDHGGMDEGTFRKEMLRRAREEVKSDEGGEEDDDGDKAVVPVVPQPRAHSPGVWEGLNLPGSPSSRPQQRPRF